MQRRKIIAPHQRDRGPDQPLLNLRFIRRFVDQQAQAGHGREGNGRDELGIIAPPGALIGLRPGPVEHEFAV